MSAPDDDIDITINVDADDDAVGGRTDRQQFRHIIDLLKAVRKDQKSMSQDISTLKASSARVATEVTDTRTTINQMGDLLAELRGFVTTGQELIATLTTEKATLFNENADLRNAMTEVSAELDSAVTVLDEGDEVLEGHLGENDPVDPPVDPPVEEPPIEEPPVEEFPTEPTDDEFRTENFR